MAKVIRIKNPVVPSEEESHLTSSYTTGTALSVSNNEGWEDNDIAVIGYPGNEKTEAKDVTGITGNEQINVSATLKFDHPESTPIFKTGFDYIALERKPTGGSFALIAEGNQLIEWDERDGFTKIRVSAGVDTDTYKWRFYNSARNEYSIYSAELAGTGLNAFQAGFIIASIRRDAKIIGNKGIEDKDIFEWLNDGQRDIDTRHERWWFAKVMDSTATRIQAEVGVYQYDLPDYFRSMDVVKTLDTHSNLYNLNFVPEIQFDFKIQDQTTGVRDDQTRDWSLLSPDDDNTNGYFGVYPIPKTTTNYFYRRYYRYLPELTTYSSQTLIPLPIALYNYGMSRYFKFKKDDTRATEFMGYYLDNIVSLKRLQKRQLGQSEFQRFRGQAGYAKMFGGPGFQSPDIKRENYW